MTVHRMTRRQQLALPLRAAAAALFGPCRGAAGPAGEAPATQAGACRSKLEWWGVLGVGGVRWNVFQEITRAFAERRPGCAVEMVDLPTGLNDKVIAAMAAGSPPALMNLPPGSVAGLAHRGVLANVEDLFKRDKLSGSDFSPGRWLMMSYGGKV
jgi:ABC-type glycerol-3-phosphate transport system substrate-binding protein